MLEARRPCNDGYVLEGFLSVGDLATHMHPAEPTAAEWLRLVNRLRGAQASNRYAVKSGDPLSSSVQYYIRTQAAELERFGIRRLFLQTKDGRSRHYYDLSMIGGHIEKPGTPPAPGNHRIHSSRSYFLAQDATNPGEGFRLQVLAHCDWPSKDQEKAIVSYCEAVATEFLIITQSKYFREIEIGATEIDRLHVNYIINRILPGTYAVGLTRRLSRAISARGAIYCVVIDGVLYVEYLHLNINSGSLQKWSDESLPTDLSASNYGWRHTTKLLNGIALPSASVEEMKDISCRMAGKEHVVLERGSEICAALERHVRLFCPMDLAIDSAILAPVIYDNQLIGCFAFLLGSDSPAYSASARSLVNRALDNFSTSAKYLFQRRSARMIVDPIFKSRDTRVVDGSCFIVMPFGQDWSEAVFSALRNILSEERLTVARADDLFGGNVVEDIWSAILKSTFIIADVTGRNPNVYYELGIAHTLGKKTILLSQKAEDIPFDTRHLRHIIYSNSLAGFDTIKRGIRGFLYSI